MQISSMKSLTRWWFNWMCAASWIKMPNSSSSSKYISGIRMIGWIHPIDAGVVMDLWTIIFTFFFGLCSPAFVSRWYKCLLLETGNINSTCFKVWYSHIRRIKRTAAPVIHAVVKRCAGAICTWSERKSGFWKKFWNAGMIFLELRITV